MKRMFVYTMACAALVGAIAATQMATAQDAKPPAAKATPATPADRAPAHQASAHQPDAMKVSEDGFNAIRAMHAARVAIFNGDPKLCEETLTKARDALDKLASDESVAKVKTDLIPIDGSLELDETFVPSPEKAMHVSKANEHFQKGDAHKGLEELQLGEIEVNFSRILMPLEATKKRLTEAVGMVTEHKYYEANLVLKAAEEALEFDSVSLFDHAQTKEETKKEVPKKN